MSDEKLTDEKHELDLRLLSVIGMNPWAAHNSSARQYMFNSHLSQRLAIKGASPKRVQTGMEQEFAKHVFNIKMPVDGQILYVIEKYPQTILNDIKFNPSYFVIYEDLNSGEISYIEIPRFKSYHSTFGYDLKMNESIASKLTPGNILAKDTIIAESESVDSLGNYCYGTELNVAFMSHPAVAEDAFLVSEEALEKMRFKKYETRIIEFGEDYFPLNLYGSDVDYKPFPDIGEYVREDSLLGALREYDQDISPALMSIKDTQKVDFVFDKRIYASSPKSKVIDIKILFNPNTGNNLPIGMDSNLKKYVNATQTFYLKLLDIEKKLTYERRKKYNQEKLYCSAKFHRLLVEALIMTETGGHTASTVINRLYKNSPMDTYRLEFTLETESIPSVGSKLSGLSGDKGVICQVEKAENMPVDADGVRAHVVTDDVSTVNRMNLARAYEQYIGRACLHIKFLLRTELGFDKHEKLSEYDIEDKLVNANIKPLKEIVLKFYGIVSDKMFEHYNKMSKSAFQSHLVAIIKDGPYLYIPPNHPKNSMDIVKDIRSVFGVVPGRISMVDPTGKSIVTKSRVLIGPMYFMLLEKTGESWSAIASGKLQHFGVLSPMTQSEKHSYPYRNVSVRTLGETEARTYAAYTGRLNVAEVMDRNNNPLTHREVVKSIIYASNPSNIPEAVNRTKVPYGSLKPVQYVKHVLFASGIRFRYFKGK